LRLLCDKKLNMTWI